MRNELTLEQWNRLAEEHNLLLGEVADLRAELAAEREHKVEAMAAVIRAVDMKIEAEAERDELRDLLGKADVQLRVLKYEGDLLARIDAALGGQGDA